MRIICTGASGFIGTNLVNYLLQNNRIVLNIDAKRPLDDRHLPYWQATSVLDRKQLVETFATFQPTHVVHLAARTDTESEVLEDYEVNTVGTANVLAAIKATPSIDRVIITSTQFVHRPGHLPEHDQDFEPHTAYGQSKVIAEHLTRDANLNCTWTIIRPTNIWGPWHPRYPHEFWRVLKQGRYFHPGRKPVVRSYGYVGNVVYQIEQILDAPANLVNQKVYYVGDQPINIYEWTNEFSKAITQHEVRVIPRSIVRTMALLGDLLKITGVQFPIHSARFQSMVTDYPTPMEPTFQAFGIPPFSLTEGIRETTAWLKSQHYI